MSTFEDALITKVCKALPHIFGVGGDNGDVGANKDGGGAVAGTSSNGSGGARACQAPEGNATPTFTYYLDGVLGSGAAGTVLFARRRSDDMPFAVKVIDVGDLKVDERQRAMSEVCCLLNCNFFSILKCHEDAVVHDSNNPDNLQMLALVLDYANAGDLRQEIKSRAKTGRLFEEHEAGMLFLQVLLAIHHVHSKHMIHRDIKSANILLCSNGLVKLGDFGFSKMYAATVSDDVGRTFCGTPYYVAPEIWRRKPYSKKADMFSLGVLLYELLTLKRPFDGANMNEVMQRTLAGKFEPLPSKISPEMSEIVAELLSGDPTKRPSSSKLLNTPICKLYMSVMQEIAQGNEVSELSNEMRNEILSQMRKTKEELLVERNPHCATACTRAALKGLPTVLLSGRKECGYILHEAMLMKQSIDMQWKKRYVCIYAEVNVNSPTAVQGVDASAHSTVHRCSVDGGSSGADAGTEGSSHCHENEHTLDCDNDDDATVTLTCELVQAVSKETMEQQCIATPFSELEDVFPVPSKYTGSNAPNVFAVAFKTGKRLLFQARNEVELDEWMEKIQEVLGLDDGDTGANV